MTTHFISGHLDLSPEEFQEHYVPQLEAARTNGDAFVVGDAPGADKLAQHWLKEAQVNTVTVYHMLESPRHNEGFPTKSGFTSEKTRDAAMTLASTKDIAWVKPGRETAGQPKTCDADKLASKS